MNTTNGSVVKPNGTSSVGTYCVITYDSNTAKAIKIVALSVLMVISFVLNSLVIAVFAKTPSLQRTVNYFLVNMAASDLLISIAAIPKDILELSSGSTYWRVGGDFGHFLCILQSLLVDISAVVSILSMTCITIDRFCAVMMPLRVNLVPGKVRGFIIALIWVLSVVNYCYYFYTLRLDSDNQGNFICWMSFAPLDNTKMSTIVVTYVAVLFGCVPWILVAILYAAMIVGLKHARIQFEANDQNNVRLTRSTSVTRQAFVIVLVFGICFFPMSAIFLVIAHVFHFGCSPPYFAHLYFAAQFLMLSNAALNPCVCLFLSENYRNGLWKILKLNNLRRVYPGFALEEVREEPVTRVT
ncbi:RYamide receptor-like [Actinia tenebrosa]|uniref:RYamide receptor-like n=1 Tax=Actinia tenebrosa TaxID=6105 RepID=A0A6P8J000_ACTTE|nr:RYamide receptor-like [Actinia tenebrosa]XP_031573122.1 RYamide receptor-like [Actinia tenebrosa]